MSEKYKFDFDQDTGIFYKYYFGRISVQDVRASWYDAFEKKIIPKETIGFILDYREADMIMHPDELTEIPDFYQEHIEVFRNFKIAIVTDKPEDIVKPTLIQERDRDYISRPFSSIEAAREWVLS